MRTSRRRICALVLLLSAAPALAVEPGERLADPALESRARALSTELRCMVCQNQSIDDSDAPLARDLRVLLREQISAGKSDSEVIEFLVARYGDFILLKPPVKTTTIALWAAPFAALAAGALALLVAARRRRILALDALTPEEEARLAALEAPVTPPGALRAPPSP